MRLGTFESPINFVVWRALFYPGEKPYRYSYQYSKRWVGYAAGVIIPITQLEHIEKTAITRVRALGRHAIPQITLARAIEALGMQYAEQLCTKRGVFQANKKQDLLMLQGPYLFTCLNMTIKPSDIMTKKGFWRMPLRLIIYHLGWDELEPMLCCI